jgi:hypothetical protein
MTPRSETPETEHPSVSQSLAERVTGPLGEPQDCQVAVAIPATAPTVATGTPSTEKRTCGAEVVAATVTAPTTVEPAAGAVRVGIVTGI